MGALSKSQGQKLYSEWDSETFNQILVQLSAILTNLPKHNI